jgi:hypothetical protein
LDSYQIKEAFRQSLPVAIACGFFQPDYFGFKEIITMMLQKIFSIPVYDAFLFLDVLDIYLAKIYHEDWYFKKIIPEKTLTFCSLATYLIDSLSSAYFEEKSFADFVEYVQDLKTRQHREKNSFLQFLFLKKKKNTPFAISLDCLLQQAQASRSNTTFKENDFVKGYIVTNKGFLEKWINGLRNSG